MGYTPRTIAQVIQLVKYVQENEHSQLNIYGYVPLVRIMTCARTTDVPSASLMRKHLRIAVEMGLLETWDNLPAHIDQRQTWYRTTDKARKISREATSTVTTTALVQLDGQESFDFTTTGTQE